MPIPESHRDLVDKKITFAHLATVSPNGAPQVTPVWFDTKGETVRVNTAKGRVKARNMAEGSKVALSILDPDNPYRYLQVRGRVTKVTTDGADAHIDALSQKYLGKPYPFRQPGEERLMVEIEPFSSSVMG